MSSRGDARRGRERTATANRQQDAVGSTHREDVRAVLDALEAVRWNDVPTVSAVTAATFYDLLADSLDEEQQEGNP